jgi:putative Mg2+ transporter-C (MgtC) family protein
MEALISNNLDIFIKLSVAMLLGVILGIERTVAHKTAGMRTYGLVSMGAALFVIISEIVSQRYFDFNSFDPLRMASQVIVGIGFLGAGLIIFQEAGQKVSGLTTAAGLWVSAGIGIASGFGLYSLAVFAVVLSLFIFTILWFIERRIKNITESQK